MILFHKKTDRDVQNDTGSVNFHRITTTGTGKRAKPRYTLGFN